MCLLERVFLSNKSMPCKWDGDRPFGGKVLGPQSRPQSKGRTCGTQQPLAEASISLHCSRTKFLQRSVMTSGRYVASLVTFPLAPTLWGRHYQDVLQGGQIHGAPICLGKEATPGIRVKKTGFALPTRQCAAPSTISRRKLLFKCKKSPPKVSF